MSLVDIEKYYDTVPRVGGARAEDFGPLTLFVQEGEGWPYYARPTLGADAPVTAADVLRVRERQRELGVPESFEWVAETTPGLRAAVEAAGLPVSAHPLMLLDLRADAPEPDPGVRLLGPTDPLLAEALTVPALAFGERGTAVGRAGRAELTARLAADRAEDPELTRWAHVATKLADGRTVLAAAVEDGGVLSAGQYNPVGPVAELVGIGTLPAARRRGLALAVTRALAADAREKGARLVFLSAGDEDVARVYAKAGFTRVATALIAEPS
ncbi:GNAT family N-acetyltransferase [Streptomyces sp. NPDC097619]|uniref:GNAT family N-acetyltransferase n=1 Tax=Streptomyces sp. NPDC097619 TaxID=3157228 RepID=UPI003322AA36